MRALPALFPLLLTTSLFAQGQEPLGNLPPFVTPIHSQADDPEGGAYGTWAAGADYKVSFHDGATFVPYLGGDYPVTQTFAWRTTSVTVGEHELATRERPLGRQVDDTRYEYDLGGVVEAYEVRLDGLEQTFVVRQLLATGDLVVRGTVRTALHAEPLADRHAAVAFVDDAGARILDYGAATAVDGAGRRCAMTTRYERGAFELRLDGAWLQQATLPVTVDPIVTSSTVDTWGGSSGVPASCDMFHAESGTTWSRWFAYVRQVSTTDSDLWVIRPNLYSPTPTVSVAFADLTTSWGNDSCALAGTKDRVVCAFGRMFGGTNPTRNVRWHTHRSDDVTTRTGYGSVASSSNNWRVDIGGHRENDVYGRLMLVYQHETGVAFANGNDSQIRASYVDLNLVASATDQGVEADPTTVLAGSNIDCERPRTSKRAAPFAFCVTYQWLDRSTPNDTWDVWVDYWDDGGNLLDYASVDNAAGTHKLGPVVSGSARALVTYAKASAALVPGATTSAAGYEIVTQRVDFDTGTHVLTFPHPATSYLQSPTRSLEVWDSDHDYETQSHWLQLVRDGNTLYADLMGYQGHWMTFAFLFTGSTSPATYPIGAGVSFAGGTAFEMAHVAYQPGSHPVTFTAWNRGGYVAPSHAGLGCSSADLAWSGDSQIGSEFTQLSMFGLPASWPALAAVSFGAANVPLGGIAGFGSGCTLLIDPTAPNYIMMLPLAVSSSIGEAVWPLALPESLTPRELFFQGIHPDATGSVWLLTRRLRLFLTY